VRKEIVDLDGEMVLLINYSAINYTVGIRTAVHNCSQPFSAHPCTRLLLVQDSYDVEQLCFNDVVGEKSERLKQP
jgi:hypothetical protein